MSTGMRVHATWRAARTGLITDIAHFAPGDSIEQAPNNTAELPDDSRGIIVRTPISTAITHSATEAESVFLDGIAQGRLIGNRIASGVDAGRVYFPPRDVSPADGAPSAEYVDLPDTGIVTTFCIVNVPFQGPADQAALRRGLRAARRHGHPAAALDPRLPCRRGPHGHAREGGVVAAGRGEHSVGNISHFQPTGEPDAEYATYQEHV